MIPVTSIMFGGPPTAGQPGSWRRWCACGTLLARVSRELPAFAGRPWSAVRHEPCGCVWEGPVRQPLPPALDALPPVLLSAVLAEAEILAGRLRRPVEAILPALGRALLAPRSPIMFAPTSDLRDPSTALETVALDVSSGPLGEARRYLRASPWQARRAGRPWRRWRDVPHPARRFLAGYDPAYDHRRHDAEPRALAVTEDGTLLSEDEQGRLVPRGQVSSVEIRDAAGRTFTRRYGPLGARLDEVLDEVLQDVRVRLYSSGPEDGPVAVISGEGYARRTVTFASAEGSWGVVESPLLAFPLGILEEDEGEGEHVRLPRALWDAAVPADEDAEEARRRLATVDETLDEAAEWETSWESRAHRWFPAGKDEPEPLA